MEVKNYCVDIPLKLSTSTRKCLPTIKKKLREKVPQISTNELRRLRMKLHEALLLEMKESQDIEAFNFFNAIIQRDLEDSMTIVNSKELVEMIFNDLKKSDLTKGKEIENLLTLGQKIENLATPITWLVDTIYSKVLTMVRNFAFSGTRLDAHAKYCYGKFLKEEGKFEDAVTFLEDSLKICDFETEWIITEKKLKLNVLVADQLHECLIEFSKEVRKKSPDSSLELVKKSLKIVKSFAIFEKVKKQVNCEMELGYCYEALSDFDRARRHFEHAFELSVIGDLNQVMVDALFKMAKCYKNMKEFEKCDEILNRAIIHAKSSLETAKLEGDLLVKIGKLWLERKDNKKALESFNKAVRFFEKAHDSKKLHYVHLLMAFPLAENDFGNLVDAIFRSDRETSTDKIYTEKLQKWQTVQRRIDSNESKRENREMFIEKFIDPSEITQVEDP